MTMALGFGLRAMGKVEPGEREERAGGLLIHARAAGSMGTSEEEQGTTALSSSRSLQRREVEDNPTIFK